MVSLGIIFKDKSKNKENFKFISKSAIKSKISYQLRMNDENNERNVSNFKINLWNCNSITSIQQHLNIMQSTYKLLTSDFVEIETFFLD